MGISLVCKFPTDSSEGAAEPPQKVSTKETETPPNDYTTKVALAPLKDDTEESLSTFMTSDDLGNLTRFELAVPPEQEDDFTPLARPALVINSFAPDQTSQEKRDHSLESHQVGSHPEEPTDIGNQPISSASEDNLTHNEADIFLSHAPHILPGTHVECNVPNPLASQDVTEEQVVPSVQLTDVIPVDPEDDISEDEEQVARLYLVEARTSYAEFKAGGDPDCLDLAIAWYQSALELIPTGHADWIMVAMENAGALEDSQRINNEMEGTTSPLEEAIKIYEQVLCFAPDDMGCKISVVSRLSHMLRLRYELKKRRDSSGPVREEDVEEDTVPGRGNGRADEDFNDDERNDLALMYLSSAREHLSTFRTESHPTSLDLAIASYRVAIRLLPPTHPDWPVASLELADALQAMHVALSDEPCGSHLGEAIEICEQVIAFSSEHSGDHTKAASRLCHALQLRYEVERNYGDLPKSARVQTEDHSDLSNLMGVGSLEEGLSDDDRAELAAFYLDAAQDTFLTYRAEGYQESADLQRAISSYRSAVSLMVPTGSCWVAASLKLGDALEEMSRKDCNRPDCGAYREEAIGIYKHMLHALPHDDENRKEVILCFLWALGTPNLVDGLAAPENLILPYVVRRAIDDHSEFHDDEDPRLLERSIFWLRKLRYQPPISSRVLVHVLLDRYRINVTPDVRLLKEALSAIDLVRPATQGYGQQLHWRLPTLAHLAKVAAMPLLQPDVSIPLLRTMLNTAQRIAAELSPTSHPQEPAEIRHRLAGCLFQRALQTEHPTGDINEAIAHQTEALRCFKALDHPERAHTAGELTAMLFKRRDATPDTPNFDQEIVLLREAVFGCGTHHPVCHGFVLPFLITICRKILETNDLDPGFEEEAMIHCDEIAEFLRSSPCPEKIGDHIVSPFEVIGKIKKILEQSMERTARLRTIQPTKRLQQIANSTRDKLVGDEPGAIIASLSSDLNYFFGIALQLTSSYFATGESNLGEQAEAMMSQVEDFTKRSNHPCHVWLAYYALHYRALLLARRDPPSRHAALRMLEEAAEGANLAPNHGSLSPDVVREILDALLRMRLEDPQENLRDLRPTIRLIFRSLPPAHPDDPPSGWELQFTILRAHAVGRGFTDDFEDELREMGFEDLESMARVIRGSLTQLHHLAQISPNTRASLQAVRQQRSATSSLLPFVLLAPICNTHIDWKNPLRLSQIAMTTLEDMRTIVWTQATRRRHPADQVAEVDPELANKFRELSRMLNNPIENRGYLHDFIHSDCSHSAETSSSATAKTPPRLITRRNVQKEWDDVVDQIRCVPGFEDFLGMKSFDGLRQVTSGGSVVVLAAAPELPVSFALILRAQEDDMEGDNGKGKGSQDRAVYYHLPLKIGWGELESLRQRLRVSLGSRNRRVSSPQRLWDMGEEPRADGNTSDVGLAEGMLGGAESNRAGKVKREKDESVESVLSTLWTMVAQPVIEALTEMEKPDINRRRRIWWCPTGPFAFMPIHAAGTEDGMFHVSDFFISSYTPTLTSLIQARERPIPAPESTKVLAAIQPNPGNGWSNLPDTRAELEEVHKFVPSQHLISLSSPPAHPELAPPMEDSASRDIDLKGIHTTCTNILSHLPTASVLHLACHGHQNKSDPLSNGFVLRNGEELTVEMLMKSQEEPGSGGRCIAVLSACDTAAIDEDQPDEMINLANAMLFVGFRSVLATLWPMADPDGPIIARSIYSELFSPKVGGDLTKFCVATVLDRVMREMREADYSSDRWATFIHIGA